MSTSIWGDFPNGSPCKIPILCVAGGKGCGKTWFCSTIDPKHTVVIDLEDSSATYSFPFLARYSLFEFLAGQDKRPTPLLIFEWVKSILEGQLPEGTKVVVIDPASDFTQGLFDYVVANASDFGISSGQSEKMTGIVWGKAKAYIKTLLGQVSQSQGVETIALTFHIGNVWKGGAPTSQQKAKGVDTFYELASLYLWLIREANAKVPSGVTVAPLGKTRLAVPMEDKDGNWHGVPCLPPKVNECTTAVIRKYIANPPDYAKLKKSEKFVEPEMTESEKLELEAQVAHDTLAAEELKAQRLEATREAYRKEAAKKTAAKTVVAGTSSSAQTVTVTMTKPASESASAATTDDDVAAHAAKQVSEQSPAESADVPFEASASDAKSVGPITDEQTAELRRLYDIVKPATEDWKAKLAKFGAKSAKFLNRDSAEQLILVMTDEATAVEAKDEATKWAEKALGK